MEDSEKQPLLQKEANDGKPEDSGWEKRQRNVRVFIAAIGVLVVIMVCTTIAGVSGTSAFAVKFALYSSNECQELSYSSSKEVHSRSGSYTLLDSVSHQDLMCYAEPQIQLLLKSRDALVGIYQTLCQNVGNQSFRVSYELNDLPSNDGPRPVFDENFSPHNYFMGGNLQVEIVNITAVLSSANIEVCLFYTNYQYNDFLRAGMKWNNYTKNATCNTFVAKNGDSHVVSFNISKPTFVFLGMATIDPVQIDQINITAIGEEISSLGKNLTSVCQLSGEDMTCNFNFLNNQSKDQHICIVAYEEGNPDGTYDYTNITINFPNQVKLDNPYKLLLMIYGSVFLGIIVIMVISFILIPIGAIVLKKLHSRKNRETIGHCSVNTATETCSPVEDTNQHDPNGRPLVSYSGVSDQLQQAIHQHCQGQKLQIPEEGTPINHEVDAGLDHGISPIPASDQPQSLSREESLVHGAKLSPMDANH